MADTDSAHHEAEESRKRAAVADEGLERKRRTRGSSEGVVEARSKPGISGTRSGKVGDAVSVASVAESLEEVRKKGHLFWNKMTTCRDPYAEVDRFSHTDFLRLPSRKDYPDYYEMIKKPMSFSEIKTKLDRSEYTTIDEMRTDFNQIFVNAKRYNAPGSPIFMDAKRLHKLMKEYYSLLTGEAEMPEEEEPLPLAPPPPPAPIPVPQPITYVAPRPNKPYNPQPRIPPPPPPGVYIKRGPTLKPWLNKKLHEFTNMRDPETGRQLTDDFKSLPDRKAWAEYYKVIMHPLAIDMVTARVTKRHYQSVQQFEEDVHLILSNALFFNEESSRIWKDARILSDHFTNIMKEVPPAFVPPRKYNTAKRRAEEAAIASGQMIAPKKDNGRGSVGGSEEPEGDFESGEEEFEEHYGSPSGYSGLAPFDLPVGINGRSREITPAGGTPYAASQGLGNPTGLPSLNNQSFLPSPQQYSTPSFNQRHSTPLQQQLVYPPTNGNGPLHPPPPAPEPVSTVLVSKMPAKHESSQILSFRIDLPSSNSIMLNNDTVRQHSIVLPSPDTNIEVALHLYQSTPPPIIEIRGKKVKSELEESQSDPSVSCSVRPSAATCTLLQGGTRGEKKYMISTVVGLNILEFVIGQQGEEGGEVYRIFCTRFP